jgi:hypothetical protein
MDIQDSNMVEENPSKSKSLLWKIPLAILLILSLPAVFFLGMKYQKYVLTVEEDIQIEKEDFSDFIVEDFSTVEQSDIDNIDDVMELIASYKIPKDQIEVEESIYTFFTFSMYYVDWSLSDYQTFSNSLVVDIYSNPISMVFDNQEWNYYAYAEGLSIMTRESYICLLNEPTIWSEDNKFGCTNALYLKDNTKENIAEFMYRVFDEAGIKCSTETCQLIEEESDLYFPVYARHLLYFDDDERYINPTRQLLLNFENEINKTSDSINERGFNTIVENYTEKEKKWDSNLFLSYNIIIESQYLECNYNIALSHYGKRNKIVCKYKEDALLNYQEEINLVLGI